MGLGNADDCPRRWRSERISEYSAVRFQTRFAPVLPRRHDEVIAVVDGDASEEWDEVPCPRGVAH